MTKDNDNSHGKDKGKAKPYDLAERTAVFGETIIKFAKKVPVNPVTRLLQEAKELHLIFAKIYRG